MVQDVNLTSKEWCNLIFEGKNKNYGAYDLRKTSNDRHIRAMLVVAIFVAAIIFIPLLIETITPEKKIEIEQGDVILTEIDLTKDVPEDMLEEELNAPPPPEIQASIAFVPPVIVEQVTKETEIPPTEKIIESDAAIATKTIESDSRKGDHIDDLQTIVVPPKEPEKEHIFQAVEQQPQFPGGDAALMRYLSSNLKYPPAAAEQGISGRIVVQFVVSKTGAISDVKVIQPLHPSCDREAVRLISSMPKWVPGKQNGIPVNVYFSVPIRFKLEEAQ